MATDLIFMGSSADRSAADVALPVAAGELQVNANGAPGTATTWYPKADGAIIGAFTRSETAGMVECRFHKTTDINYVKVYAPSLQTDPLRENIISPANYPITTGDQIEASGENAGAVLDVLGLYVAKSGGDKLPTTKMPDALPAGAVPVRATATFTHVADSVATGTLVFDDYQLIRDQVYKIIGMAANSATGCGTRLKFLEGPNLNDVPGVPTADTSTGLEYQMFYGDFGQFKGQTPPQVQTIAVGADAATVLNLIIVPVSGGK